MYVHFLACQSRVLMSFSFRCRRLDPRRLRRGMSALLIQRAAADMCWVDYAWYIIWSRRAEFSLTSDRFGRSTADQNC